MTLAPDRFNAIESLGGGALPSEEPPVEYPIWLGGETGQTMLFEVGEPKDPPSLEPTDDELSFGIVLVHRGRVVGRPTDDEPDILIDRTDVYRENEARPIIEISPDRLQDGDTKPTPFASLFVANVVARNAIFFRWEELHAVFPRTPLAYSATEESSEHADWKVKPED